LRESEEKVEGEKDEEGRDGGRRVGEVEGVV